MPAVRLNKTQYPNAGKGVKEVLVPDADGYIKRAQADSPALAVALSTAHAESGLQSLLNYYCCVPTEVYAENIE